MIFNKRFEKHEKTKTHQNLTKMQKHSTGVFHQYCKTQNRNPHRNSNQNQKTLINLLNRNKRILKTKHQRNQSQNQKVQYRGRQKRKNRKI